MDRVIVRASNYAAATFIFVIVSVTQGAADSATWSTNPGSGDYNLTANWSGSIASAPGFAIYNSPLTVSPDTATFGSSSIKTLSLDGNLFTLDGWKFTTEASDYIFNVHNVLTFQGAGIVVNGGSVSIDNSNFLFFENSSTAGKATIANEPNSALIFGGNSSAGHASIINSSGGVTYFIGSSTGADASIENSDGGGTFFDNNSTAGNASIVNKRNGFTVIGDNATAGNASIVTNAGGYTDFSPSTGPNGDNKLSAGSIAGDGFYYLGANELTVGSNNLSTSVSGVISDCGSGGSDCNTPGQAGGSLVKVGTGTLTLAGVNIYTGSTTVNGGTLEVDGSIASPIVTVNSGGTLAGTGTTGNSLINAGGTLAPGSAVNPYGAMAINGSLTFAAGSFYNVNISPAVNSGASVTGAATLGGATVNARYADGSYVAKQYTILTAAGGVSGAFNSLVNTNLPSGFKASLGYDADNTYLNLSLSFAPPSSPNFGSGLTANQQGVGNALVNFFNTTGGIPLVYGTLTPTGLTQISGEVATASQQSTFDAMNLFMGAMTDPFSHGGSATSQTGVSSYAAPRDANAMFTKAMPVKAIPFTQRWNVWAAGFGSSQDTDGNAATGSSHAVSRVFGTAVGADYSFSPATVAGFALAGGGTNFGVTNAGSGHSDLFQAGAFVRHTAGAAYVSAALAYGWQDVTTNRTLAVAGVDQLQARFNANAYSGRLESGYRVVAPWLGGVGITPYAAAQFTTFALPAYAEKVVAGANTFALAYAARSVTDTRSELGLRTDKSYALSNAALTLRGRVAWAHDFNPDRGIAATFQALPGASFVVNGAAQARDAALTTASAELKWMNGWSAVAMFEGELSDVTRSYAGKGVVRYAW